ncbi:LEAF RUST 10 DISEASE-RESISTANCE LOCUS RECEPTOR-LIKE PROTEIN KINASE-like 1.4 isoform X2 [Tripterygium wilfordii]|uniref:LEAF RUST 10 DISEASE-RESISTANCE LOCUS RECEPTOR-LIKE PROTEIN KINASE-like 1.4 isoform X2 n=1 Tax=Tripterygium wilfordii TaxID=458696 RepID=UPI0018F8322A|nr:LEAF RUST 10 DISEASE-RESISTANCE LOCUS RECEPTOR-LIKE PROTEIN KINASE-like 1.4 isoform X2 [Tripterygium wilfordii]
MHSNFHQTSLLHLLIILFAVINVPRILCQDDQRYLDCQNAFECGDVDVGYPFWGLNRPEHCGQPDYALRCEDNVPKIEIGTNTFRILDINPEGRNLTVARDDLWSSTCPTNLVSTTIDTNLFTYASMIRNMSLFYNCTSITGFPGSISFPNCTINGASVNAFYLTTEVQLDPSVTGCSDTVIVPLSESSALDLDRGRIEINNALDTGFSMWWNVPSEQCNTCLESGGSCGYQTSAFTCFCHDGPNATSCSSRPGGNSGGMSVGLGVGIGGAGIIFILLGCWLFLIIRRRKRKAALFESKVISGPPSSKSLPTPTTNFSQSIPSYPSSKSDLEKGSTYFGVQVFSYTELEKATDNFDASKELGDGGFGIVYYGVLSDGRVVAVKRLYESSVKRVEQFMNEVEILARLRHKNLVTLFGCTSKHSRDLILVYEYIPNGTVADHLLGKQTNSGKLTWPVRLSIALETAEALAFLHAFDVIHRDVKTNNILLDNNFHVKVADFGLSRLFPTNVTHVSTAPQGTPGYVDPEYYQCYHLTDKSDVYSFGVVLIELISSLPAVDTNRHRHDINLANMAINKIQNHALHELVDPCLGFEKDSVIRRMITSVVELAFRCLQQERDMRPSMEEVREILRGIQNENFGGQKAEVVDIGGDDVGLLKNSTPPLSPDSVVTDKWVSSSTTTSSF